MAVAFDAFSSVAAGTGTLSWTHTPVGTPKGVKVDIVEDGGTNGVTGVTYGGVAMELVAANAKTSGEAGTVITYFLGRGIPTGAQTISVSVSDAVSKRAGAITVTAATAATCWTAVDISVGSDSLANPTSTLNLRGKTSFVSLAAFSGQNAVTGITQSTGWTSRLEHTFGVQTAAWYSYNTIASANVACGWTQTADDAVMVALAITEAPLASDTALIGLTDVASKAVVFDSRSLPILIMESASVTILTSISASDSCAVQTSEGATSIGRALSTSESVAVQASESASKASITSQQALPIQILESSSLSQIGLFAADSMTVQASEVASLTSSIPFFAVGDSAPLGFIESRPVIFADNGALVVEAVDALTVQAVDAVNNLQVFVPGSTQNFIVSDAVKVQLNGSGVTPTNKSAIDSIAVIISEPLVQDGSFGVIDATQVQLVDATSVNTGSSVAFFSVSDSLTVQAAEVTTISANTIITTTDSMRVQLAEDIPDIATVILASESLQIIASEPNNQFTQLGTAETLAVQISGDVAQISGMLMFQVSDSLTAQLIEFPSFGTSVVKTVESISVQCSEDTTKFAAIVCVDLASPQFIDVPALFNAYSLSEQITVQCSELASPIFNNFLNLSTSEGCAVQCSEAITTLVSFLAQMTVSDATTLQIDDLSTEQDIVASINDSIGIATAETPDIFFAVSVADSCTMGTVEQGLAIPIVIINVATLTGDAYAGFDDATYLSAINSFVVESQLVQADEQSSLAVTQPSAETVAAFLLESVRLDLAGALTESNTLSLTESVRVDVTQTASDSDGVQIVESAVMQPGFYFDDSCGISLSEQTNGYVVVPNASPDTWNGTTEVEHKRRRPHPGRYRLTTFMDW